MMNKFLLSCIFIFLSMTAIGQTKKSELNNTDGNATAVISTKIYCDHCIQCEDCGANIMNKVRAMNKGIKKVKVNPEANTITVIYNPEKTNIDQIRKAINTAGFDADDQLAPADIVAKLDGCCKKKE